MSLAFLGLDEGCALQKLQNVAAEGVMPGDGPSARRVQTVLRFTQRLIKDYERAYGTDDFLDDDFQACDMKCFEFEMVRFSSGILGVDTSSCSVDDGPTADKPSEEIKELVARKHWLRLKK